MSKFIIGLTGGIGSGKTTVSNMFAELGVDIIDADVVAREAVAPNSVALTAIESYFGAEYINAKKQLDRAKLRTRIFSNPKDKEWLNSLLHPLIRQEILNQLAHAQSDYCILVAPLLLENSLNKLVSRVLVVDIDEASQVTRTLARDTSSQDEIKRIIASQISRNERLRFADDIIDNQTLTIEQIRQRVQVLHHQYYNDSHQ
ncbi:dephospho-CoA kinase [Cognaticolwellia mytili]|uniref:dephospho-CoA kinase n=1 Tax=Cognaticolwellia mytili TaxID=1888913 RepID=UPI000A16D226|nr:dephospho-CoA kinase [Cognaticolwellia mytili]